MSTRRLDPRCSWETFFPLPDPARTDVAPELDGVWLAARGIDPGAPRVLAVLREQVLPLVRRLEAAQALSWYCFLVHDQASGAPDHRPHVHLRLVTKRPIMPGLPLGWAHTRHAPLPDAIAGVRPDVVAADAAWCLLGAQSAWVLSLVEQHRDADMLDLVRHVRQFLHFFANMTQMVVQ